MRAASKFSGDSEYAAGGEERRLREGRISKKCEKPSETALKSTTARVYEFEFSPGALVGNGTGAHGAYRFGEERE